MTNQGTISLSQFKLLLESHGIKTNKAQLENLVDRFDKKKDGKITFEEFADEVRPRSPIRRVYY